MSTTFFPETPLETPPIPVGPPSTLERAQPDLLKGINNAFADQHNGEEGLSVTLRKGVAKAHDDILQPEIVGKLVSGSLPRPIHLLYLLSLHRIYSTLEGALSAHSSHPLLSSLYNPLVLARTEAIEKDCAYYSGDEFWLTRTLDVIDRDEPEKGSEGALEGYVKRLKELGDAKEGDKKVNLLVAHSYVRYLGDLSGGQTVSRSLRKSYSLPEGQGTAFYEFPPAPNSTSIANATEIKNLKQDFRDKLDLIGLELSQEDKEAILKEANEAFKMNINVFRDFEKVVEDWSKSKKGKQKPPPSNHPSATIAQRSQYTAEASRKQTEGAGRASDNLFLIWAVLALSGGVLLYSFLFGKDYLGLGELDWEKMWDLLKKGEVREVVVNVVGRLKGEL